MINYKTKDIGMSYTVGDTTYTIQHSIVRLLGYEDLDNGKIKMHLMFQDGREAVCEPFIDDNIELYEGISLKIAYIDLNRGMQDDIRIHGYEVSNTDTEAYPEAKLKPFMNNKLEVDKYYTKVINISNIVKNNYLKSLLDYILKKYEEPYKNYPAGTSVHHSYKGGLIQHSISVMELAYLIAKRFNGVDIDLIITAALLHDIGKVLEYNEDGSISDVGKFRDHISIGADIINNACIELEFPEDLKNHLIHIILSHHGKEEWGSTKKPGTKEAFIIHIADYIDSQMFIFNKALSTVRYGETGFDKYLNRNVIQTSFMDYDSYLN